MNHKKTFVKPQLLYGGFDLLNGRFPGALFKILVKEVLLPDF